MEEQKGITLITLVITIVILIIITGVVTYNGLESVNTSQKTAFISELEIIQAKVNVIYEERKASPEKIKYYNSIGQDISNVDVARVNEALGQTNKDGFSFFNQEDLKKLDLDNIKQEVLINYDTREVVSLEGFTIDGVKYYKLKDIPNYIGQNIEYINSNTQAPEFTVSKTKLNDNEYRFKLENIVYNSNVNRGTVKYKKHSETNWILNGESTSFTVKEPGLYDICFTDSAGNETIRCKYIYVDNGLIAHYDGDNNTGNGHNDNTTIWKDLSGNGNDGVLTGGTWIENALYFNGTTDWVNLGKINYPKFSIKITFIGDIIHSTSQCIIGNWESGGCGILLNNTDIRGDYFINNEYKKIYTKSSYEINKIYNIILTYDGSTIKMFLNGKLENTIECEGKIENPLNDTVMAIGVNPNGNTAQQSYYKGKVYSVNLYNRGLSDSEVKTNYEIDKYRFGIKE